MVVKRFQTCAGVQMAAFVGVKSRWDGELGFRSLVAGYAKSSYLLNETVPGAGAASSASRATAGKSELTDNSELLH